MRRALQLRPDEILLRAGFRLLDMTRIGLNSSPLVSRVQHVVMRNNQFSRVA